ncbi:MAG TPA: hypothetical protein VGF67_21640 [Ktedonobacteraceae bacterium]|jgi:uncharacterized protein with von Willebrand factor type A (vWA) domain
MFSDPQPLPTPPVPEQEVSAQSWLQSLQDEEPQCEDGGQISADAYDRASWQQMLQASHRLQQAHAQLREVYQGAPALLQDLFLSFFKAAPVFSPRVPSPLASLHRQLLSEIFQTRAWQEMHATGTWGDPVLCAMGALGLCERVLGALDAATRQQLNALYAAEQALRQLLLQARELEEAAIAEEEAGSALAERLAALAEQRRREAQEQALQCPPLLAQLPTNLARRARVVRQAARESLQASLQAHDDIAQALTTLGTLVEDETARVGQTPLREKMELAEQLQRSSKLREIALLCGQLLPFAHAVQQTRLEETPEQIDGVTLGRDLNCLLPGELALWDDPHTELLFLRGFVQGRLWQYEMGCPRMEARGPLIVALDSSGSMSGALAGQSREVWSKAVALCLLSLARHQARDIAILHFSGRVTTYHFVHGQATLAALVECAGHFDGGNTYFEPWMREALRLVDTASFDRADVICISDGLVEISEAFAAEWNRRRAQRGMRVFGILLAEEGEALAEGSVTFARVADTTLRLSALSDQQEIAGLFAL